MAGRNVVQSSMDGVRLSPHGTSPAKPDAYQRGKCHECKKSIHNNKNPKRDARHTRGGGTPGSRDGRALGELFGAVLRRLLIIPAPRRPRASKRPAPLATNDGPGLAHTPHAQRQ